MVNPEFDEADTNAPRDMVPINLPPELLLTVTSRGRTQSEGSMQEE